MKKHTYKIITSVFVMILCVSAFCYSSTKPSTANLSICPTITVATTNQQNPKCYGDCNGSVTVSASGGASPYTYNWSNSETGTSINNLCAGYYTVYVTDINACSDSSVITIYQPPQLKVVKDSSIDSGGCNGAVWLTVTGGTTPYYYAWGTGGKGSELINLCSGTYCCSVTDALGCHWGDSTCIGVQLEGEPGGPTKVNNISLSDSYISVYPNPSKGIFSLSLGTRTVESKIDIYNVYGEKIYMYQFNSTSCQIDLSSQPVGIYLYRVLTKNGEQIAGGKLIIE